MSRIERRATTQLGLHAGMVLLLSIVLVGSLAACGSTTSAKHDKGIPTASLTATPLLKGWNTLASPRIGEEGNLLAVTAQSANDVWAVGQYEDVDSVEHTLTERWDGSQWTNVASPSPGRKYNVLTGVSAVSANDVWAVGHQIGADGVTMQLIEHWDGTTWSVVSAPVASKTSSDLTGVAGLAANNVWAVGSFAVAASTSTPSAPLSRRPLIEHWDGTAWSVVSAPVPPRAQNEATVSDTLNAVTALSATNIWAVGGGWTEHWDGHAWSIVQSDNPYVLTGVSAVSANDIWAVGSGTNDNVVGCAGPSFILSEHWDGSRWSGVPVAIPSQQAVNSISLTSVAAVSTHDVWAVGGISSILMGDRRPAYTPVIEHWDGTAWRVVTGPSDVTTRGLTGVAASSGGTVWAVGQSMLSNEAGPTYVEQWDGHQWSVVHSPSPGTLSNMLNGVSAVAADDIWAVGSSASGALAEHWNGTNWSAVSSSSAGHEGLLNAAYNGVSAVSSKDAWAVGSGEKVNTGSAVLIDHWNGTQWSVAPGMPSGKDAFGVLNAVSADASNDVWAVGGNLWHWDGARWSIASLPSGVLYGGTTWYGVVAISPHNVWAVGGNPSGSCAGLSPSKIVHWDGTAWSVVPHTPTGVLYSVAASGSKDVWAVGVADGQALIMHWDGAAWSVVSGKPDMISRNSSVTLQGVTAHSAIDAWAVGYEQQYSVNMMTQMMVIEHWNGTTWSRVQATAPGLVTNILNGVASLPNGDVCAVGYYQNYSSGVARQALFEYYRA